MIDVTFSCTRVDNTAQNPDECSLECGNGALDFGEACDDANSVHYDGCTFCTVDDSYTCSRAANTAATPDTCSHRCGNGALDSQGGYTEECDDGGTANGDGCSSSCSVEANWTCARVDNSVSNPDVCGPLCGNGALDAGEVCDDGNVQSDDGCSSSCTVEEGYECSRVDTRDVNPDHCVSLCGNRVRESSEECDDGGRIDGDGCSSSCLVEAGWICSRQGSNAEAVADTCSG